MSAAHSILAPSSAVRWVQCAASVLLEALYPETESEKTAADEGTAVHWVAAELLSGRDVALGQVAPVGVVLTEEMIDAATMYVEAVDAALANYPGHDRSMLHVEERVDIPYVHALNWGTPDTWFIDPDQCVIYLFDLKYGHRHVDEYENWQLIDYAAGVLEKCGIDGFLDQTFDVVMTIVQPRSYHRGGPVRSWRLKAAELRPYFNTLQNAADTAMQTGAVGKAGPECLYCRARHACETLQRDAYRSATISASSVPVDLTPAALGLELHMLRQAAERLKGRITGLEEQARQQLRGGQRVPFFALVEKPGREQWAKPVDEVLALGTLFNADLSKPREAITPGQARTLLKKAGLPADVIGSYSTRSTALSLEPDDGSEARKNFALRY